jgi:hypothetical protein
MRAIATTLLLVLSGSILANVPPDLLNYQGVLRNASDQPLDGSFDMVFRLIDGVGGNEIMVDRHEGALRVAVAGGLFSVQLGGGVVSDGAGPGTYTSLSQVFRDFQNVHLRVQVNGETLSPDVRVVSAAYAHNATYLNGVFESQFLRSDENDTAVGKIFFAGDPSGPGVSQGSVFISPTSASPNETLLGVAVSSIERFKIDAEGDVTVTSTGTYGVNASGFTGGGHFYNTSGDAHAYAARASTGINASGSSAGAEFSDTDGSGYGYVGFDHRGVHAGGNEMGGALFDIDDSGFAYVGYGDRGIHGYGTNAGGYFEDNDTGGHGYIGWGSTGVAGYGATQGGYFQDLDGSSFARVGSTYKINGTGAVSFVQNHPTEADRVIVYAAPEGDEVATYTRGTAHLSDGEARVRLGETFAWVTNPDLGLTAQLTPRGEFADLYVASVSTTELVVRSAGGASSAAFDYQVWGLRIGFEETSVVQEKEREAYIPSMADHRDLYARHPELRRFNALERFEGMAGGVSDLGRSAALVSAVGVYDPQIHGPIATSEREVDVPVRHDEGGMDSRPLGPSEPAPSSRPDPPAEPGIAVPHPIMDLAVQAEPGDVLSLVPDQPGLLQPSAVAADPRVIGVVAGLAMPGKQEGTWTAPVASWGVVLVRADAAYGSIRPGDLLTTSPTAGHAMRAMETLPGTLLGKALEGLESGRGSIRMVVLLR